MCTTAFIKRHILSLPEGEIFSTRELLNYGRRAAVDQCLYRLVKTGRIVRLAWGLFMKDNSTTVLPSVLIVAAKKAAAFGRRLSVDCTRAANILGLIDYDNSSITYSIEGHSTSFKYGNIKIYGKGVCTRKLSLDDETVGLAIKALCRIGKADCEKYTLAAATRHFNSKDRLRFKQSCHLMPAWLTNLFQNSTKHYQSIAIEPRALSQTWHQ